MRVNLWKEEEEIEGGEERKVKKRRKARAGAIRCILFVFIMPLGIERIPYVEIDFKSKKCNLLVKRKRRSTERKITGRGRIVRLRKRWKDLHRQNIPRLLPPAVRGRTEEAPRRKEEEKIVTMKVKKKEREACHP